MRKEDKQVSLEDELVSLGDDQQLWLKDELWLKVSR
jgi:hypothetical protein